MTDARDLVELNYRYLVLARELGHTAPLQAEIWLGLAVEASRRLGDLTLSQVRDLTEQTGVLVFAAQFAPAFWQTVPLGIEEEDPVSGSHAAGLSERQHAALFDLSYQYLIQGRELSRRDPLPAEIHLGIPADVVPRLAGLSLTQLRQLASQPGALRFKARFGPRFWQALPTATVRGAEALSVLRLRAALLAAAGDR
ncbi:MAG: hypothetical protein U1F76_20330 [Candidatus Competibacteraceae bacterium]